MNIDVDQSGTVSMVEFEQAFKMPKLRHKLVSLGYTKEELKDLFLLLDTENDGQIEINEFVEQMEAIKGPARSVDLFQLIKQIDHCGELLTATVYGARSKRDILDAQNAFQ